MAASDAQDATLFAQEYGDKFDPEAYAKNLYSLGTADEVHCGFPLGLLDKFWKNYPSDLPPPKILDYGAGPTPIWQISSALHASEIVMAEFAGTNREALQRWVDGDASWHDWSPYFKYVAETLEGKGEEETKAREAKLRSLIKAVVPCDATQDPPIERGYEGPYDVAMTFLCLPAACKSVEDYKVVVTRFASLVKPGGRAIIYEVEENKSSYYKYEKFKFHYFHVTEAMLREAMAEAGFVDVEIEKLSTAGLKLPSLSKEVNYKAVMFVTARKST